MIKQIQIHNTMILTLTAAFKKQMFVAEFQ